MPRPTPILQLIRRLVRDETAASHIEYALIAGFAGVSLSVGLITLKDGLVTFYTNLAALLAGVT